MELVIFFYYEKDIITFGQNIAISSIVGCQTQFDFQKQCCSMAFIIAKVAK